MTKALTFLFLLLITLFVWPTSDRDFFTRGARELLITFLLAPCVLAYLIWRINRAVAIFLVWIGLTSFLNILLGFLSIKVGYQNFAFVLCLAILFYSIHKMNIDTHFIIKSIAFIAILQALWGIFQNYTGIYWPFHYIPNLNAPCAGLDNASNFASFLAISLPCCFYVHYILGLVVLSAILVSKNFIALSAGLIGLFFLYPSKKLLIFFCVLIIAFFFTFKRQCLNWPSSSIMTRTTIWSESLRLAKYKEYIGYGLGNYKIIWPQYMQQKKERFLGFGQNELWDSPANDYVRAIFEVGFIALLFILAIILVTIKKYLYYIKTKEIQTLFSSFMVIVLVSCGYSIFLNPTNAIWAVLIFALLNQKLGESYEKVNNRNLRPSLS